jgi:hypothetical protein
MVFHVYSYNIIISITFTAILTVLLFRKVPFVLVSTELGNPTGVVHINVDKADQPLPLTTVFHKLIPLETTPYTLFQTIIGNGYPVSSFGCGIKNLYLSMQYSAMGYIS